MGKLKVGIVRGGPGPEHNYSVSIGEFVLKNLLKDKYDPVDILVTKEGDWHIWGVPTSPYEAVNHPDVVLNTVIDGDDESFNVQKAIENFQKPFVGSDAVSKSIAHTRHVAREILSKEGIKTPYYKVVYPNNNPEEAASEIFNSLSPPWRLRFSNEFSNNNAIEVNSYKALLDIIKVLQNSNKPIIVEEYIKGYPVTCFVVEGTDGSVNTYCIGEQNSDINNQTKRAHQALGLKHFSKANFLVSPRRGAYLTSVYAHPEIHEHSPLIKQLSRKNITPEDYLDHLISLALK